MMARRVVLGLVASGMAALVTGCGMFGRNRFQFRLTVEVETPLGLRSGSSVYAVSAFKTSELTSGGSSSDTTFKGEATAVDLPGGKTLFALLRMANGISADDHLGIMAMRTMDPAMINTEKDKSARRIASGDGIHSPVEVAPVDYPLLVTFGDIDDPASVRRVDPANLAASFGPEVQLKRIVVEVVDADVTEALVKKLKWLPTHRGTLKPNPPRTMDDASDPDLLLLGTSPFSTELYK